MNLNSRDMLDTGQSFKREYSSSSNFDFIVSFQYREIYVAVFTTTFEQKKLNFFHLCR